MKAQLQVICFLLVVCTTHCSFTNFLKGIAGFGNDRHIQSKEDDIREDVAEEPGSVQAVKVPERLFSKEVTLARKSHCYQARLEFASLCGLHSPSERARLASLVTNCHLEVSGRPVFVWDPVKKLADADEHYVYLVMQFIPLMSGACEKAGLSPLVAQLVADTTSNDDLRNKIDELQDATELLFEANRQSSEFVMEYMNMSADASSRLMQMLNLSVAIKEANDAIDTQRKAIQQEAHDIKAELRAFTQNSISLFESMFGRFDGFQTQVSNMESVVGQLQSESHVTSMFLKAPLEAISNTSSYTEAHQANLQDYFPVGSFRKVGFLKKIILGPIKLSERIRHLESNRFLGPFAKDVFSSFQLFLVLLSVFIAYHVLTMFTKVVEATLRFATVFRIFQPLVDKLSLPFSKECESQPTVEQLQMKEQLSEHISTSVTKALAIPRLAEELAKIVRNDGTHTKLSLLFTRMSEFEMRLTQISEDVRLLHITLQSLDRLYVREIGTNVLSHETVALHDECLERSSNAISVLTASEAESKSSRQIISAGDNMLDTEESESSANRLSRSENRRKERDRKNTVARQEANSITPKSLTLRRSSRKKVR